MDVPVLSDQLATRAVTMSERLRSDDARRSMQIADSLELFSGVHDVISLGVSARRGPVLWSHVLDVRSRDCPFVAALLTFEASDSSLVTDMSTTQSCR